MDLDSIAAAGVAYLDVCKRAFCSDEKDQFPPYSNVFRSEPCTEGLSATSRFINPST